MRFLALPVALLLVLAGCAATETSEVAEMAETTPHVGPVEGFQPPENFDQDDVASMRESRDAWVAAFAAGDAEAVDFMFEQDAVMALPEEVEGMSGEEFFNAYTAELSFDEAAERFITDGGDPRVDTHLPWVSYYGDFNLTLTPKMGGEPISNSGQFMTRFHRQEDLSLEVIRGPSVGDPAPLFALNDMKGGGEVELASLFGEKPTVLVFGSYT